jgi:hypothetical protein
LLQGFAIERGVRRLGEATLVRRRGLLRGLDPLRIGRQIQESHILLFDMVVGVDHVRLMTAKLRAIKQEPEENHVSDEGDPYSFTPQSTGTLIFEPVNQV